MFRIIAGVLAAFVGFSFGHSIPKWMQNKTKSAVEMQCPSPSESVHPVRKLLLRRKPLRKFKFGSQKLSKEHPEVDGSLQPLSKGNAEGNAPLKCSPSSSLCASTRVRAEHQNLKFGSQKLLKEKTKISEHDLPLSAINVGNGSFLHQNSHITVDNGYHSHQHTSVNVGDGRCSPREMYHKAQVGHQHLHEEDGSSDKSRAQEPVFCKISSMQSMCGSPVKEKSQMKQWKMKLMSLRSKAMASEKAWYEKFESEHGGNLLMPCSKGTAKKHAKGKENESPQMTSTKRRDLSWSRSSSSKMGLLVEGPKAAFER